MDFDELSSVRDLFFESAVDPTRWCEALDRLTSVFDGWGTTLVVMDKIAARPSGVWLSRNWDPGGMDLYATHYGRLDPAWPIVGAQTPLGQIGSCTQFISEEFVRRNEFYNEFLIPQGGRYLTGGRLFEDDREIVGMSVHSGRQRGPLGEDEVALLRTIWPSLMTAIQVSRRLAAASFDADRSHIMGMAEAFDRMSCGAILMDRAGRVVHANRRATHHLGDSLRISNNRLSARDGTSDARLQQVIRSELTHSGELRGRATVRIARPHAAPLFAFVMPILNASSHGGAAASSLIMLVDPTEQRRVSSATMIDFYGLTPAEARIAAVIGAGRSVEDAATQCGIQISTAQTHLKRIFHKMGIGRQAQLVSIVSRLAAIDEAANDQG